MAKFIYSNECDNKPSQIKRNDFIELHMKYLSKPCSYKLIFPKLDTCCGRIDNTQYLNMNFRLNCNYKGAV